MRPTCMKLAVLGINSNFVNLNSFRSISLNVVIADARTFRQALATTLRAELAVQRLLPGHVADMAGMHPQTVRRVLAGDRDVTVYELLSLAEALDLSDRELLLQAMKRIENDAREQLDIQRRTDDQIS
jgi:transcriptional regulator with XRE-family HTH domain